MGVTNRNDGNQEKHQFFFLQNYRFCKEFCQIAKYAKKLGFYFTFFKEIHFLNVFIVIRLPICNLDGKNQHLNNRKGSIVQIICYVPSKLRNVIDHNVA